MTCTRCQTSGFLNLHLVDDATLKTFDATGEPAVILQWIRENQPTDVTVCDCCGDGIAYWHGTRGEHDHKDYGDRGPYAYNGGLPECH